MNIKTITTVDGVNVVDFGAAASRFYWVENLGSTTVYVSEHEDVVADGDNVKVLSAGCSTMIESLGGKIYILGAGKFQITNQGDKFPPFRNAPAASDGGVQASGNPVVMDGLQGGVPLSEITVSGDDIVGHELTVNVSGKNIIAQPFLIEQQGGTLENNGITYTLNTDKSITANGTATADSYCMLQNFAMSPNVNRLKKNTDYFLSGSPVGSGVDAYQIYTGIYDNDGNRIEIYHDYGNGVPIRIANDYRCITGITIKNGQTVSNLIFRPQLELGDTATAYEPYHGSTTTITPDSNPYTVPNDIRQQEGLNVVSVSEGEISVTGVRKNAAVKKIWDKIDELTTAIIVSNGETIE